MPQNAQKLNNQARRRPVTSPMFVFPADHHLLVTTDRKVRNWHAEGVSDILHTSAGGITAAQEAGHGRALFAVANGCVVMLHDNRALKSRKWNLRRAKVYLWPRSTEVMNLTQNRTASVSFVSRAPRISCTTQHPYSTPLSAMMSWKTEFLAKHAFIHRRQSPLPRRKCPSISSLHH